jgi:branched-chain amino acid transport system substrate-binding protein
VIASVERWKQTNGDTIAGHEIQIVAEDDGCTDADQGIVAAERLIQRKGLAGVIGPQCSAGVEVTRGIYDAAGVVEISGSATAKELTTGQPSDGFFFRTAYRNDLEGTLIGLSAALFEMETAYLIDDSESYGRDLARNALRALDASGVDVTSASIVQGGVDFSVLAGEIAAANVDFVGFAGFNPEAGLLYRQLRDAGYTGIFGAGDAAASESDFVEPVGDVAEGALFAGCRIPLPDDLGNRLEDLTGRQPSATFSAHYADAATILLDAIASVATEGSDGSLTIEPTELRDAVRASQLTGLSGEISFDAKGDRVHQPGLSLDDIIESVIQEFNQDTFVNLGLVACQVQDGELVNVFGPEAAPLRIPD